MENTPQELPCDITLVGQPGPYSDIDHSLTNSALLALMNQARSESGLTPLKHHPALILAALGHVGDMADHNQMSHYGLRDGSTWADRCGAAGYPGADLSTIAENVAGGQTSPEVVFADWMNSGGHRAAILNPVAQHVGAASATGSQGWIYWCVDFGHGAPDPIELDYLLI